MILERRRPLDVLAQESQDDNVTSEKLQRPLRTRSEETWGTLEKLRAQPTRKTNHERIAARGKQSRAQMPFSCRALGGYTTWKRSSARADRPDLHVRPTRGGLLARERPLRTMAGAGPPLPRSMLLVYRLVEKCSGEPTATEKAYNAAVGHNRFRCSQRHCARTLQTAAVAVYAIALGQLRSLPASWLD